MKVLYIFVLAMVLVCHPYLHTIIRFSEQTNNTLLSGDVPRSTSYGVYISQLIRFARLTSHVADFNARNKSLTAKLLQQGYRYHKLRKVKR